MTQADRLRQPLLDREDQEVTAGHDEQDEVEYEGDFTVGLVGLYMYVLLLDICWPLLVASRRGRTLGRSIVRSRTFNYSQQEIS